MTCAQQITDKDLCRSFLTWQCQIRQIAMRRDDGRPSPAMQPRVFSTEGDEILAGMTILLTPDSPQESLDFFRHQIRKTHDPKLMRERGLAYLQSTYYQNAGAFSDKMTALFHASHDAPTTLRKAGQCILEFAQYSQIYRLRCDLRPLPEDDVRFQITYWHNRIFNPHIPPDICVLEFIPEWRSAQADPQP